MEKKRLRRVVLICFKGLLGLLWLCIVLLLAILTGLVDDDVDLRSLIRSLPSDERMMDNFWEHREDFEKLVQTYHTDPSPRFHGSKLMSSPEVKAIMRRVKVCSIHGDLDIWRRPDPYSEEVRYEASRAGGLEGIKFFYIHGRVAVGIEEFDGLRKGYYYAPMIPRINRDPGDTCDGLETPTHYNRLYKSLDTWPDDLPPPQCVYRQIDLQWFIILCRG